VAAVDSIAVKRDNAQNLLQLMYVKISFSYWRWVMLRVMVTCLATILLFTVTVALGQKDTYTDEQKLQQQQWEDLTKEGEDLLIETEQEWNQMLREQQRAWERMVAEINYSDQYSTRSYVNFEKGDMVLATMVKTSESRISELSKERIKRQLAKVLSSNNPGYKTDTGPLSQS
jgi:hypothetical protein